MAKLTDEQKRVKDYWQRKDVKKAKKLSQRKKYDDPAGKSAIQESNKKWYDSNRDEQIKKQKKYNKENAKKRAAYAKEYYKKNKDKYPSFTGTKSKNKK